MYLNAIISRSSRSREATWARTRDEGPGWRRAPRAAGQALTSMIAAAWAAPAATGDGAPKVAAPAVRATVTRNPASSFTRVGAERSGRAQARGVVKTARESARRAGGRRPPAALVAQLHLDLHAVADVRHVRDFIRHPRLRVRDIKHELGARMRELLRKARLQVGDRRALEGRLDGAPGIGQEDGLRHRAHSRGGGQPPGLEAAEALEPADWRRGRGARCNLRAGAVQSRRTLLGRHRAG